MIDQAEEMATNIIIVHLEFTSKKGKRSLHMIYFCTRCEVLDDWNHAFPLCIINRQSLCSVDVLSEWMDIQLVSGWI